VFFIFHNIRILIKNVISFRCPRIESCGILADKEFQNKNVVGGIPRDKIREVAGDSNFLAPKINTIICIDNILFVFFSDYLTCLGFNPLILLFFLT